MKTIRIYDYDAERIEEVCEANDMSEHELIELLLDYLNEVKEENNLK